MRLFFTFLIFNVGAAYAAPLSWDGCVSEVRKSNPELEAATQTLRSVEFQYRGSYGGFFPQVSGSLGYDYGDTATGSTQGTYSASITARQNLFSGFADAAAVRRASALLDVAKANYSAVQARISFDLKSAFATVNFADEAIHLFTDIVSRREANLKLVELRYQSGRENKGSLLLSRAYLEQAKLELMQAGNSRQTQKAVLGRVLGSPNLEIDGLTGDPPLAEPPDPSRIEALIPSTPEYRRIVAQEQAAEAGATSALAGFFPSLNLSGTTGNGDTRFFPGNNRWSIGVALVIPLFAGGRDYYATKSAYADLKAATLAKENAFRQGRANLFDSLANYREAVQRWKVDKTFAEAVLARAKIAREKYNNGLLSFEDWDVIENDLIARQRNLLQSQRDRIVAEAAWEQLLGRGVF